MDYKDISDRIALLTQEIRELQRMNAPHEGHQRISRASHEERELQDRRIDQHQVVEDDVAAYTKGAVGGNPPTIGAVVGKGS